MARSFWSDRPLGVKLAALVAAGRACRWAVFARDHGAGAAGHRRAHRRAAGHTEATGDALRRT